MPKVRRSVLRGFFSKGAKPSADQFGVFVDSVFNLAEDIGIVGLNNFDPSLAYDAGKTVVYNQAIYQSNQAIQPGPFNSAQWTLIAGGSNSAVKYKGTWDAKNNIPDIGAGSPANGDFYIVSVSGNTSLGGITNWVVGDWAIFNTTWSKVNNNDKITDAQNLGSEGSPVYSNLTNTILYFRQLVSRNNSLKLSSDANTIDFSVTFDDGGTSPTATWSASKISSQFNTKADKVAGTGLSNHIAALDNVGNLKDSGYLPTDFLPSTTSASNIPVTPYGSFTGPMVQDALQQLDDGKETKDPQIQIHIHDTTTNPHNVTKAQVGLGLVDNTSDINKPVSLPQAAADNTVLISAKAYADSLVIGLLDDRGNYDASSNQFPTTGGSGSGGAIRKGDLWTISNAGTLPGGNVVEVGDVIRALIDAPGQTSANWAISQNNIGYVAENSANKVVIFSNPTNTQYPSALLVKTQLDTKADKVSGTSLNNHIAALDSVGNLKDSGYLPTDFLPSTTSASNIPVTPYGSFTGPMVQNALQQLDDGKETKDPQIQIHIHDTTTNPHNVTKAQVGLGLVDNTSDINKPVSLPQAAADNTVLTSAKAYADSLVIGLLNDRGNYDASGNQFPTTGGSGSGGGIKKGDLWTISVPGTLPGGNVVEAGDVIRALTNSPGQTAANWAISQNNIGYVAENTANKVTIFSNPTNTQYPSALLVKTQLDTKEPVITPSGNAGDFWNGTKTFVNFANTVRSTVLTGLSLATNQVISATDSIIQAFGYLQKQVSDNLVALTSHILNTSNPHNVTKAQVGLSNLLNIKDNVSATVDPTSTDDNTLGYSINSSWVNTASKKAYVCVDATTNAAVWKETTFITVYGNDYLRVDAATRTTTTSTTFQNKLVLSTGTRNGTYSVEWYAVVDNNKKTGEFRLFNAGLGTVMGPTINFDSNNSANRIPISGCMEISLTGGPGVDLILQYRAVNSGDTQGIGNAYIAIKRVA